MAAPHALNATPPIPEASPLTPQQSLSPRPQELESVIDEAQANVIKAATSRGEGWMEWESQNGVRLLKKEIAGTPIPMVMGQGLIAAPAAALKAIALTPEANFAMDKQLKCSELLEQITDEMAIVYTEFHRIWPTSVRDFVLLRRCQTVNVGGTECIAMCLRSVEHEKYAQMTTAGNVNGKVLFSGWLFEPRGPAETLVSWVANVDVGGWIPAAVIKSASRNQAVKVVNMKGYVAKNGYPDVPGATVSALGGGNW